MADMDDIGNIVIGLSIALFLAGALLPTAITSLFGANTTTWSTEASSMWQVTGLLAVVAFAVAIVGIAIRRRV